MLDIGTSLLQQLIDYIYVTYHMSSSVRGDTTKFSWQYGEDGPFLLSRFKRPRHLLGTGVVRLKLQMEREPVVSPSCLPSHCSKGWVKLHACSPQNVGNPCFYGSLCFGNKINEAISPHSSPSAVDSIQHQISYITHHSVRRRRTIKVVIRS